MGRWRAGAGAEGWGGGLARPWLVREGVLVSLWAAGSHQPLAATPRNDTGVQAKIVYLRTEDPKLGGPGLRPQQLPGVGTDDPNSLGKPSSKEALPWAS